jgi:hypothetical protein
MRGHQLPNGILRGVLSGRASLLLPIPSGAVGVVYHPPALGPQCADYAKPIRLDLPPGWRTGGAARLDVVFLVDESGSMYGSLGDPFGVRRAVALSVVDLLARAI